MRGGYRVGERKQPCTKYSACVQCAVRFLIWNHTQTHKHMSTYACWNATAVSRYVLPIRSDAVDVHRYIPIADRLPHHNRFPLIFLILMYPFWVQDLLSGNRVVTIIIAKNVLFLQQQVNAVECSQFVESIWQRTLDSMCEQHPTSMRILICHLRLHRRWTMRWVRMLYTLEHMKWRTISNRTYNVKDLHAIRAFLCAKCVLAMSFFYKVSTYAF